MDSVFLEIGYLTWGNPDDGYYKPLLDSWVYPPKTRTKKWEFKLVKCARGDSKTVGCLFTYRRNMAAWTLAHMSHAKKNGLTFHYTDTGCLIGIITVAYHNPYETGQYNPLHNLTNQVFFIAHVNPCHTSRCSFGPAPGIVEVANGMLLRGLPNHGSQPLVNWDDPPSMGICYLQYDRLPFI